MKPKRLDVFGLFHIELYYTGKYRLGIELAKRRPPFSQYIGVEFYCYCIEFEIFSFLIHIGVETP